MKALMLENPHTDADPFLTSAGLAVTRHPGALQGDELIEALQGVTVLGIRSKTNVTAEVLKRCPSLRCIGAFCIGTNQIDVAAATAKGVAVFNAPFSNTRSVVELAIGEIIALMRRLTQRDRALHEGRWEKSAAGAHEVRGKTLGIIGYGNIGAQLSVVAEALGMTVVFYDKAEKLALGNAQRMRSLDELLRVSDIISLHVDGVTSNASMFGAEQFAKMKSGSIFLNLSRGFVVDTYALRDHILEGHIAGAAVDVFPSEPNANGEPFDCVLRGLPNVILTPHIGGSTLEAQVSIAQFVGTRISRYVMDGTTSMSVNLPRLALDPSQDTKFRLTYVHRNTPGVLALINQALAEHGVNITGQILGTAAEIGYVITDIASDIPDSFIAGITELPDTIRLRIIDRKGVTLAAHSGQGYR
ncbi:D-3-phosphoglycerate dehydrogenase [Bowdeniella nasicola]|uniref:D-3-phosphoglycerate dehydrogenase n=1 Tax=Bowdeniella nasicola TaxID=208480 RepID=A0A1Q5Q5U2_9ACTO|nr:phosphoglycerate dehydrogenase [Bowdeniella nasicola]OKL55197.1 D-3-phosphoglycerate dehydrogenase [Bowdeniella nasicola]